MGDLVVGVWEKATPGWAQVGQIFTHTSVSATARHLSIGEWSLSGPLDEQLALVGKRNLLTFDVDGVRHLTGRVRSIVPSLDEDGRVSVTLSGDDVTTFLRGIWAWPVPGNALSNQNATHYTATGAAETVLSGVVSANLARLSSTADYLAKDAVVVASQGRGGQMSLELRFKNLLEDVLIPKCRTAGLGFRAGLVNTTSDTRAELRVWFYRPADRQGEVFLSPEAGTVRSWTYTKEAASATRAIILGQGQGTARTMRSVSNAPAEAQWGWVEEQVVDTRDTPSTVIMDERGNEALAEGAPKSTFELKVTDTEGTRPGIDYGLGDTVFVEVLPGAGFPDVLSVLTVEQSDGPVTFNPSVGDPESQPLLKLGAILRAMRRARTDATTRD